MSALGQNGEAVREMRTDRTRWTGEAAVRGGYGHTDPYKANLKINATGRAIDFKSYIGR